ncbi:unnamed protein product, partial [Prorocentrum cordatum]
CQRAPLSGAGRRERPRGMRLAALRAPAARRGRGPPAARPPPRRGLAAGPAAARAACGEAVAVTFEDGLVQRFHWLWLRDNCQHESQITANGQRLFETADLVRAHRAGRAAEPASFELPRGRGHLLVSWKDGHSSRFSLEWLRAHAYDQLDEARRSLAAAATSAEGSFLWGSGLAGLLPEVGFEELQARRGRVKFSWLLERFGFVLVRGVPVEPGAVERVGNMLGSVRRTNYGTVFDVLDRGPDAKNLADTAMSITQHTDNPYRDPVPGVQLLHCLVQADSEGGETLLVDGFAAAERLRARSPKAFELLARQPRAFRYVDAEQGTDLRTDSSPVLEVDEPSGAVRRVRFNNRSAAPLRRPAFGATLDYYEAWAALQGELQDERLLVPLRLAPGDLVAFQNHRVLHGRRGYARGARRHLQGAYLDVDALRSLLHGSGPRSRDERRHRLQNGGRRPHLGRAPGARRARLRGGQRRRAAAGPAGGGRGGHGGRGRPRGPRGAGGAAAGPGQWPRRGPRASIDAGGLRAPGARARAPGPGGEPSPPADQGSACAVCCWRCRGPPPPWPRSATEAGRRTDRGRAKAK